MTTTAKAHTWAIAGVNAPHPHLTGAAATHADTWTPALGAGRAALLYGALPDLAVTVNDDLPTVLYWPARDGDAALDPAVVTADLVSVHQQQTAAGVAAPIAGCLGSEALRAFPVALSTNVGSNAQRSPSGT